MPNFDTFNIHVVKALKCLTFNTQFYFVIRDISYSGMFSSGWSAVSHCLFLD